VLQGKAPAWDLLLPATVTSVIVLIVGYLIFRRLEGGIADVA
jgi:ABC-type polysaccharide/polyol phosphate export permease